MKSYCLVCQTKKENILKKRKISVCLDCQILSKRSFQNNKQFRRKKYSELFKSIRAKKITPLLDCQMCQEKDKAVPLIIDFNDLNNSYFFCQRCKDIWSDEYCHTVVGLSNLEEYKDFLKSNPMGLLNLTVISEYPSGIFCTGLTKRKKIELI